MRDREQDPYVEDDEFNFRLVERILTADGHEVVRARDDGAGPRTAAEQHPDLALMDMRLRDLAGFATARWTGKAARTASTTRETTRRCRACGASGVLKAHVTAARRWAHVDDEDVAARSRRGR